MGDESPGREESKARSSSKSAEGGEAGSRIDTPSVLDSSHPRKEGERSGIEQHSTTRHAKGGGEKGERTGGEQHA